MWKKCRGIRSDDPEIVALILFEVLDTDNMEPVFTNIPSHTLQYYHHIWNLQVKEPCYCDM